jgi:hypothetical protein
MSYSTMSGPRIAAVTADSFYHAGNSRWATNNRANVLCGGHWFHVVESPEEVLALMEKHA